MDETQASFILVSQTFQYGLWHGSPKNKGEEKMITFANSKYSS